MPFLKKSFSSTKKKPVILVYAGSDTPSRGDTHGYVGLAQRVAERTGGEYLYIDDNTLETMYPHIGKAPHDNGYYSKKHDPLLEHLFTDKGLPDFLFSRQISTRIGDYLDKNGEGLIVTALNEHITDQLGLRHRRGFTLVPHHLTPQTLKYEGRLFAEEYAELPRPFIGIIAVNFSRDCAERLAKRLGDVQTAYSGGASIFISSCHRTSDEDYEYFLKKLRGTLGENAARYPVIDFDFKFHAKFTGMENIWNPYIGILDQCDHIILSGYSRSILSEIMTTGKTPHKNDVFSGAASQIKSAFDYAAGAPFKTPSINTVDMTDACARAIINHHSSYAGYGRRLLRSVKTFVGSKILGVPQPQNYKRL